MKTVEERAAQFVKAIEHQGYDKDIVELALILILKEQDRDTRHACAEAVLNCGTGQNGAQFIDRNMAHAACMNVKAI